MAVTNAQDVLESMVITRESLTLRVITQLTYCQLIRRPSVCPLTTFLAEKDAWTQAKFYGKLLSAVTQGVFVMEPQDGTL